MRLFFRQICTNGCCVRLSCPTSMMTFPLFSKCWILSKLFFQWTLYPTCVVLDENLFLENSTLNWPTAKATRATTKSHLNKKNLQSYLPCGSAIHKTGVHFSIFWRGPRNKLLLITQEIRRKAHHYTMGRFSLTLLGFSMDGFNFCVASRTSQ